MASLVGGRSGAISQVAGSLSGLHCDTGAAAAQLQDHLKACINARDYGAAQHISGQLQELKQQQERYTLAALTAQQADERAASESAFAQARQELSLRWQQHMSNVQDQLMQAQQHMLARQEEETTSLLAAQMSTPVRPRFTPHLLNMRRVEHTLAEQRDFTRAIKVKQEADRQELLELQCIDAEKLAKWELERTALAAQHTREQAAAEKKVASSLLELQMAQQQELEQLTRRFQATQLLMARTHASQQLKAATALRGTLGLSKPSSLLNLPSFNTSLAPAHALVAPLPANPAEACRPPLFQDSLSPAPSQGPQPMVPTLLAGTPGYSSSAGIGSLSALSLQKSGAVLPSNSSIGSCLGSSRGGSPSRRCAGFTSTPRSRGACGGMLGACVGGGGVLGSRAGSPPHRLPMGQGVSQGVSQGLGSSFKRMGSFTTGPMQQPQQPQQPQPQQQHLASNPSLCYSRGLASVGSKASMQGPAQAPAEARTAAASGLACNNSSFAGSRTGSPARTISPARVPHPPCQPSASSNRPCSPAVRIRAKSPPTRQPTSTMTGSTRGQDMSFDCYMGPVRGLVSGSARFPSRSQHAGSSMQAMPPAGGNSSSSSMGAMPFSSQQQQQVPSVLQVPTVPKGASRVSDACAAGLQLQLQGLLSPGGQGVQAGTAATTAAAHHVSSAVLSAGQQEWLQLGRTTQGLAAMVQSLGSLGLSEAQAAETTAAAAAGGAAWEASGAGPCAGDAESSGFGAVGSSSDDCDGSAGMQLGLQEGCGGMPAQQVVPMQESEPSTAAGTGYDAEYSGCQEGGLQAASVSSQEEQDNSCSEAHSGLSGS